MNKTKQKGINVLWIMLVFTLLSFPLTTISEAADEPDISVSLDTHDFGLIDVGAESSAQFFGISNIGALELTINAVTIIGTDADEFEIQSNPCSGNSIAPSGMCMVKVIFSPQSGGSKAAGLEITSNDPDTTTLTISLNGTGVEEATDEPDISVSPSSYAFGSVTINTAYSAHTFEISNSGTANLTIGAINITGLNATSFDIQNDECAGEILAPSASCTFQANFAPFAEGSKTASIEITSNDPDEATLSVSLNGTGIEQTTDEPDISVSSESYAFDSVTVNTTSSAHTFEISNSGSANLTLGTITIKGLNATSFDIRNDECAGQSLAPSASCTLQVIFAPFSDGSKTASIEVTSNDADTPILSISLSGTSLQQTTGTPDISVTPASHNFGSTNIGTQSLAREFIVSNNGTAELVMGTQTITGTNASEFTIQSSTCAGKTLTASAACTITAIFSPKTEGSKSASLEIPSNDPDQPKLILSLTGTATKDVTTTDTPNISITPVSDDFGMVGIGSTSSVHSFQITNTGKANLITGTISLTGSNSTEFNIQTPDCSWKILAPSETCSMNLSFSPVSKGGKNATLEIPSNDPDTPTLKIPLSGTAIKIWTVCASGCEYSKIQPAIDAASNGDTILVGNGTYSENIDFKGKFLTLTVQKSNSGDTWDVNGDGKLGLEEALYILRVLVGAAP